jgi:glyoxylase-like metal-dependent hydrolase (beta-lactamase superfamily II)
LIEKTLRLPPFTALRPAFKVEVDEVDIALEGGEVLSPLGGLQVVHTPGHTPGSISLFSSANKLLIVGDALNKHGRAVRLPPKQVSRDLEQAVDSAKKMAKLDFSILCFGHGRPLGEGAYARLESMIRRAGH